MSNTTVLRASDFMGAIGVNAHISYTDGGYVNAGNVLADLGYLGLSNVRSESLNHSWDATGQSHYATLANAGIKFDLVVGGSRAISDTLADLDAFASAHPGAVAALEGPNEINNFPISYLGMTGGPAAIAFQNNFYTAVSADSHLKGTPVYSFTLGAGATPTGGYDAVSLHPYPAGGAQPFATLSKVVTNIPANAVPVITETGYSTLASAASGVDELTQAKLTLNEIFDAEKLGVKSIYLYELMDAYADPTNSTLAKHYGLFDNNNNPKLAATSIHNLGIILADNGSSSGSFQPISLDYTISGAPASGNSLEIAKSSGAVDIAVWNEPQIWNSTTHSEIAVAPSAETINLGAVYGDVKVFDPLVGTSAIMDLQNVSSVTVSVSDHPLIIEVSNGQPATTAINGTTGTDRLFGSDLSDHIDGKGGSDYIYGNGGDDYITVGNGTSLIDGGTGSDTVSFAEATSGIKIQMGSTAAQVLNSSVTATLLNVEAVVGTNYNDIFTGSAGNDHMSGGGGDDTFTSVSGHDIIDGGSGTDTISFGTASHGVTVSLADTGVQSLDSAWTVQLSNIEAVTGSNYADTLTAASNGSTLSGGGGDDMLIGGAGNDTFVGGAGSDTVSYVTAAAGVSVSLAIATAQATGGAGLDKLSGVENLIGSAFADNLKGDANANKLIGGAGNDVLQGGGGSDTLTGGTGSDTFVYTALADSKASAADIITDFSSAEGDKINLAAFDKSAGLTGKHAPTLVDHFSGTAGQYILQSEAGGTFFQVDTNGDGVADFGIHIHSSAALTSSDFIF